MADLVMGGPRHIESLNTWASDTASAASGCEPRSPEDPLRSGHDRRATDASLRIRGAPSAVVEVNADIVGRRAASA
ncbi:MAG: hypothetical protein ACYCV7_15090, partial [Acidimicrobiales bacterium]